MTYIAHYQSPLGALLLASNGKSLTGLWFEGQKYFPIFPEGACDEQNALPVFATANQWLNAYFAGQQPSPLELPLNPAGSAFRQEVWKILCQIPYGMCSTYGHIATTMARRMNKKSMSSQAVGGAVGHNPLSIIIPCHRVVGATGALTGYAGGMDKKTKLLALEKVPLTPAGVLPACLYLT